MIVVITIPLLLLLIIANTANAFTNNQSSYKFGFDAGFGSYQLGVTNHGEDGPPDSDTINADCISMAHLAHIINSTACFDGFLDGWTHWCGMHERDCAVNAVPKPNPNYIKDAS